MPDELDRFLDQYQQSGEEAARAAAASEDQRRELAARFAEWVTSVAEPALQDCAERLRAGGLEASVQLHGPDGRRSGVTLQCPARTRLGDAR